MKKLISILFPIFSFLFFHCVKTHASSPPYSPDDNITINCGSSGNSTPLNGRDWTGDVNSKFAPMEQANYNKSVPSKAPGQGSSVVSVPYMTARISRSQFTYSFPVTAGPKFIRLYFYPASYPGFDRSKAFFTVTAGSYTLLRNFSASLTADYDLQQDSFFKEFCVNVEENQKLNLTFAPSPTTSNDTYAFINGIEIVSMPTYLYYSPPEDEGPLYIGQSNRFPVHDSYALEMVYRLNVGGASISPENDTGMFRSWSDDSKYVLTGSFLPRNKSIELKYKNKASYTAAPDEVYKTARTMSNNATKNNLFNLTWALPVDSGFNYLVRLHFCEFDPLITKVSDRQFEIYIDNQTAEVAADVIEWSGGNGIPVYNDYVVMIENKGVKGKPNLFIALHPRKIYTAYPDAILNGMEVFKLSRVDDHSLAGPNPEPSVSPAPVPTPVPEKSKTKKALIIAVAASAAGLFVILSLGSYMIFRQKRKQYGSYYKPSSCWRWSDPHKGKSSRTKASSLPEELCRQFSFLEIKIATRDFHEDLIIGEGGFGNVYKGEIDEEATVVAIKRLNPESRQGFSEFRAEIEMLSQLRHVHLVSLIGYCNEGGEMILVYEHMSNGTLREHLYNSDKDPLPWKQRLEICIGAASGLHYLHSSVKDTIIHRDVKTTNILLDEKWVAKVSDFGLSKIGRENTAVTTIVKGTFGYLDPEYAQRQQLTEKSDVYSFGVVLLEVICARKPVNHKLEAEQVNLAYWTQNCIQKGILHEIIDPYLMGKIAPECFKKFVEIAESCVREKGIERPKMGDVMENLKFALQLQESADAAIEGKNPGESFYYPEVLSFRGSTTRNDGPLYDSSSSGLTSMSMDTSVSMGTNVYGLSFPSLHSDNATSGDIFTDTTISKGQ